MATQFQATESMTGRMVTQQVWRGDETQLQFHSPSCHDAGMAKAKSKKNPAAVALGRLGGLKGGPARTASMTPAERKAAARKAALARWSEKSKNP
jgi:hypothetical protein